MACKAVSIHYLALHTNVCWSSVFALRVVHSPFLKVAVEIELPVLSYYRLYSSVFTLLHSQRFLSTSWSITKGTRRLRWGRDWELPMLKSLSSELVCIQSLDLLMDHKRDSQWACRLVSTCSRSGNLSPAHPHPYSPSVGGLERAIPYWACMSLGRNLLFRILG